MQKCKGCKQNLDLSKFRTNSKGAVTKRCVTCLAKHNLPNRLKCPHGKRKDHCYECGGSGMCEHKKQRYHCRQCRPEIKKVKGADKSAPCVAPKNKSEIMVTVLNRAMLAMRSCLHANFEHYFGCTPDEYVAHIESQFEEGMTWGNNARDGWHIDHILPLRADRTTLEETLRRLHYTNTRPLWSDDNMTRPRSATCECSCGSSFSYNLRDFHLASDEHKAWTEKNPTQLAMIFRLPD